MDNKYIVDEIIDDIVKLEDCNSKKIISINKKLLPSNIFDGAIIIKKDNNYYLDMDEYNKKKNAIRSRMDRLKKNG